MLPRPIFPRSPLWWLTLLAIVLLACALFLPGYNFSLPYIDHPDEPAFNLAAQMIIDQGSARPMSFQAYPPGIISLNYVLVRFALPEGAHASAVLPVVRLLVIACWLGSAVVIALLGWQLHPYAGLVSAFIWVTLPVLVMSSRFAIPNGPNALFSLLALWMALVGTLHRRRSFTTASVFMLMLAIVFKTQAIFLLPVVYLLPLADWFSSPAGAGNPAGAGDPAATRPRLLHITPHRAAIVRQLWWNGARLGLFLVWLLVFYPTLEADQIPYWVAPSDGIGLPSWSTLSANLTHVLAEMQPLDQWTAALSPLLLLAVSGRARWRTGGLALLMIVLAALSWWIGVSLFGVQNFRQFFPLGALLTLLRGLALMLVVGLLFDISGQYVRSLLLWRWRVPAFVVGTVLALLLMALPALQRDATIVQDYTRHDRRNDLAQYMDTSLPSGRHIATWDNHKTLNPDWGGYRGTTPFPFVQQADLREQPLADWLAQDVAYAIVPYDTYDAHSDEYYPDATTLLKAWPPDDSTRGPSMVVLRLAPIQTRLDDVSLGPLHLYGYDLTPSTPAPGDALQLRLYWQADAPLDGDYRVFNHLLDAAGNIVAQADGTPHSDPRRTTDTWRDPTETMMSQLFTLTVPDNLAPGSYRLVTGFYRADDGQRLRDDAGNDSMTVATFTTE